MLNFTVEISTRVILVSLIIIIIIIIIIILIKMDVREVGWEGIHSIDLAQDRDRWLALVNAMMNLGVP
jgi:hypothetical protein